jgi:type IV pilus assembly protein PilM
MSPQHAVIEFQDRYCQVFLWQSAKGVYTLKSTLRAPLERPQDPEAAARAVQSNAAALRQALRSAGLNVREALALIPKQWVTLRIVTLPSSDPHELGEMARFEAERHIPFNVERHVISHFILDVAELEGARVLIAAIDGPPAQDIIDLATAAGIFLTGLEVSTVAQANSLRHSGLWDSEKNPTVAHIDIGLSSTDITILHRQKPIFARSIALGLDRIVSALAPEDAAAQPPSAAASQAGAETNDAARLEAPSARYAVPEKTRESLLLAMPGGPMASDDPEPGLRGEPSYGGSQQYRAWTDRLVQEIRRTHDFARREFECEPLSQVFVSGPGAGLRNLSGLLEENLGVAPQPLDPFGGALQLDRNDPSLTQAPTDYVTAAGALLRDVDEDALRINLLPPDYIRRHASTRRRRSLVVSAALVAALLVCCFMLTNQVIANRKRQLDFYQSQIELNKERAREIQYRKTVVRLLKENTSKRESALAILDTISSWQDLFSEDEMRVSLTEFNFVAGDSVRIEGNAREDKDLNEFVTRLEKSEHFRAVRIQERPTERAPYWSGEIIRYTVNCYFKDEKQKKTTESKSSE